ncbi:tyrosine--tRNA ligase [Pectobacterium carotovorum]|uniref:tyrosine--tRNA ligase n=1 Tax=Pectobacterium carotovorum TaxID=554 RepID=UPI002089E72C|nr:tyrosine--tRNA ligase [Pectobacterium carotovorum]GKV91108.1 tyrosine--tRNA ligase [Pectobacterium carotovorum subsp. carotovorum]
MKTNNNIDVLASNIAIMEPSNGLEKKLEQAEKENRKLIIKLGFDPTAPDLHLGHAVVLRKLKQFQDAGHDIVIIIGDFTASIGDPTGRNKLRPPLSEKQIALNSQTYLDQLGRIIDTSRIQVRRNSDWFRKMPFSEILGLISRVTLAQMMQRDDFKTRYAASSPIHLHELLYPILQGYDSVMINADIELGGTDQLFNNMVGRMLQESFGSEGQSVITMPLLEGLDGKDKMSKSKGNYIALTDSPEEMYGKIMSLPDPLIISYFSLATNVSAEYIIGVREQMERGKNPILIKKDLAHQIVGIYHDAEAADAAAKHFERVFQRHNPTEEDHLPLIVDGQAPLALIDFCSQALAEMSRSELRRLIRSGAVRINTHKETDELAMINPEPGMLLWLGKHHRFIVR